MERLEELWLNHRNKIIALGVGVVVLIVCISGFDKSKSLTADNSFTTAEKTSHSQKTSRVQGGKAVCVDVKGAVTHPGIYRLPGGSRVNEAVIAAGHETPEADMNQVNLAKQLVDAQVIYIPRKGEKMPATFGGSEAGTVQSAGESGSEQQTIVNLNTATKEQLCTINGIGDKKADLILQYRQQHGNFKSVDDLKNINGFGDKTVAKLKPSLAV